MIHSSWKEEEEEDEEEFYESLDRILSSSCSSASASASSDDDGDVGERTRRRLLPISAASLDIWISQPSSIEERRRRLLQQLGLAGDPSLARVGSPSFGRSVSCNDESSTNAASSSFSAMARSRSDGASGNTNPQKNRSLHRQQQSLALPASAKPPRAVRHQSSPGIKYELSDGGGCGGDGDDDDDDDEIKQRTIKNLDTGKEFVVNEELREDGIFRRLREKGTGRHLSMEEFDMCVGGLSPIVQVLMRRQDKAAPQSFGKMSHGESNGEMKVKRRGGWLKSIKNHAVKSSKGRDIEEKDSSSSSTVTDDSHGPQRTKVRNYGKPRKELSGLFMSQEIKGHNGAIWTIKFSLDGKYLASAGEDCVINVWRVSENEKKGEVSSSPGPFVSRRSCSDPMLALACIDENHWEKKRRAKLPGRRKSVSSVDQLMVPEYVFALSEKPVCSFQGHLDDVLDLSWSKSEHLLSSSMDKTVKLWHLSSDSCLKTFSHRDYVTCIQFNPVDDRYFISGSLDEKVRIWSIPDRLVVDWNDQHEMVTAVCYTPDGQSALVGSHTGNCHLYDTLENKLLQRRQIDLENKKRKSGLKKVTGFQFSPGTSSEVLVTSADSRIRVLDGFELVHKLKGFRNTSSQISACFTANGKYVVSASEDSHVYVWRYNALDSHPNRFKGPVSSTQSYEHFHCQDVTVAVPWPMHNNITPKPNGIVNTNTDRFCDKASATWPEENLFVKESKCNPQIYSGSCNEGVVVQSRPAWGMVIVTAGHGGQIRTYQNFGFPLGT